MMKRGQTHLEPLCGLVRGHGLPTSAKRMHSCSLSTLTWRRSCVQAAY